MDAWQGLLMGLANALTFQNLMACVVGCAVGTLVGILPGLGPVAAMSLLLSLTFGMDVTSSLVMLAGIWYGAMYGGSTTSILVNVPGEAASVITCIDGHKMALKGRAGPALAIAAIGSFVAGTIGIVLLTVIAPPLGRLALKFGPPEFAALAIMGLVVLSRLSGKSVLKAYAMTILGVMLSTVGTDAMRGVPRFTLGFHWLSQGLEFVPVIMGLWGLAEVLEGVEKAGEVQEVMAVRFSQLMPSREDLRRSIGPIFRGGILGFFLGLIPGPAAIISTYGSYSIERALSKRKEEFGEGAIEGVAAPEAANNAATAGGLVPLLSLGIPFSPAPALLMAAFMTHGILPGPLLMTQHPKVFWSIVASMYIGNVVLLILNLPLVTVLAQIARLPSRIMMPLILAFCFLGGYAVNNSILDLWVLALFGLVGYGMKKVGYEPAPLALGLIIGPMFEDSFRQTCLMLDGDLLQFANRPPAMLMLIVAFVVFGISTAMGCRDMLRRQKSV